MRVACLTTVAPGNSLAEQCDLIAAAGCSGVETIVFPTTALDSWVRQFGQAASGAGLTPAVVILGGLALYQRGQTTWIQEAVEAVAAIGAAVLITPEYRAQDPLPLFPPFAAPRADELLCVEASVRAIAGTCAAQGVPLLLEPITQFEGRFWRTLEQTAAIAADVHAATGADVGIVADFHNMNITEANPVRALHQCGRWVRHVHLADNNRRLPGEGHIDFGAGLRILAAQGFSGWYTFECAVQGEFVNTLAATIQRLQLLVDG